MYSTMQLYEYEYEYDTLQVHMVIPQASCLRNGYAIPLGYAEIC